MDKAHLLLDVWREACRHIELEESIDRIARRVGAEFPADALIVRRLELERGVLDTAAASACRPGATAPAAQRIVCTPRHVRDLVAWSREGTVRRGASAGSDDLLSLVGPQNIVTDCLAGPLRTDEGPSGFLALVGQRRGAFGPAHEKLFADLLEPLSVALANSSRFHELARLREALEADKRALLSRLERQDVADAIVGIESGLRGVMLQIEQVAATDVPVLIVGETGTGKEVLARALHSRSRRAAAPIVRVNCGAIPPGLVDSQLFGHERGSFTGAFDTRRGWFERADGGTLFLDEIGELPLEAQVRLLRILQDGTFERVGGQRALSVDVRLVAATNRDLRQMVADGTFREDLWYRIGVFPVQLPPLRERREDIPRLAAHFAWRAGNRLGGAPLTPTPEDVEQLLAYDWPGNVRELVAVIERAAILGAGHRLHVAAALGSASLVGGRASAVPRNAGTSSPEGPPEAGPMRASTLDEAMRSHLERALRLTRGRIDGPGGAAERLAVNPYTLRARMRKLGVDWTRFKKTDAGDRPPGASNDEELLTMSAAMARHISGALEATRGRIEGPRGAAARLGINPHTLRARMRNLGVEPNRFRTEAAHPA
jgi:transcriptional regulator with GAF, ATPase, and Fis domain